MSLRDHYLEMIMAYAGSDREMDNLPIHEDPATNCLLLSALAHQRRAVDASIDAERATRRAEKSALEAAQATAIRDALIDAVRPPFPGSAAA